MKNLLTTKEVANFLNVNEKMVYTLVSEKGLPASKITGKWLFPGHLVEQWVDANTINYPQNGVPLPPYNGLLIITGSNDPLLDRAISVFNSHQSDQLAVFGNLGSMGGLRALRQNLCHMASSHLLQDDESEYNFDFAFKELDEMPAVVNFCRREQGILVPKGNPKNIATVADLAQPGMKIINRSLSTGTRLLLDKELKKARINGEKIEGYATEVSRHLDVGLEILAGRADAGPAIRAVAKLPRNGFSTKGSSGFWVFSMKPNFSKWRPGTSPVMMSVQAERWFSHGNQKRRGKWIKKLVEVGP